MMPWPPFCAVRVRFLPGSAAARCKVTINTYSKKLSVLYSVKNRIPEIARALILKLLLQSNALITISNE